MGGRGSAGGGGGSAISGATREIETTYYSARGFSGGRYKDEVLEATSDRDGNVTFSYATPTFHGPSAKTNRTQTVSYNIKAGAVNGEVFGINWSKVKSISGQTYNLRQAARDAGLTWDRERKMWARR